MRALHLGQHLAVVVALSLPLLLVGVVGLGVGIQHGAVVPPDLNVSLSGLHIVAYTTDPIACDPYLPCPAQAQDYYVVWVFRKSAPDYGRETGHRILTVPLRHRFDFTRLDRP
jgi:hypothetical protein